MIDLLFIALFQMTTTAPEAPAQSAPPTEQAAADTAQTAAPAEEDNANRRRCRDRQVTGTRLSSVQSCRNDGRNGHQSQDTRDALHDMQRPAFTSSN